MTGRARGRGIARGRSRGGAPLETRRPGEQARPPPSSEQQQQVGRGTRSRGAPAAYVQPQETKPPPQQATEQPPVRKMEAMAITEKPAATRGGGEGGRGGGRGRGGSEPHTRPEHIQDKTGTSGRTIAVVSNYVTLKSRPNTALYQYNVSYSPPIEVKKLRIGLLYSYEGLGNIRAFDGMILYLPHKLPEQVTKFTTKTRRDEVVEITITLTNELSANSPICLQLFNVIFRRILQQMGMIQIGRQYYYNKRPIPVPAHKLELWPGFVTSILQYERNVMLNLDVSHKILRTDTVYDYMNATYISGRPNFHDTVTKELVGEIVLTRYNNKTYRIDDIDFDKNPNTKFKTRDGTEISFREYYKKTYDLDIRDLDQPLVVSNRKAREVRAHGSDEPIILIPEFCTRTGLSEDARSDYRVMKDLGEYTRVAPEKRKQSCLQFISDMNKDPKCSAELNGWNLSFDNQLIRFGARVLPPEMIFQKKAKFSYKPHEADWSRDMRGNELITPVPIENFVVISTRRDADKAHDFVVTLQKIGPAMGIRVNPKYRQLELDNDRTDNFIRSIDQNVEQNRTQLVVVILPSNRKDRYDAIKKKCCKQLPVPSQCILAKTLAKKQTIMSVVTKVAMQINCKLGGELWTLEVPLKNVMIIGIDTYHDSAKKGRSVMGFIASTNNTLSRYYSQCFLQMSGQELGENLRAGTTKALNRYRDINGAYPDRIIVYRDGVGDGQLSTVVDFEIAQMKSAFVGGYNPRFAVVVVKKRINTRIFSEDRGELRNPPPGTVVDTEVTKPEWYDFFIVSQSVRQGTVTPTHFNVISDTSGLKPDHMQRLTYKLCHLYYNWPGTVRVPAPCQYAHKLAFLVGQSIHDEPSSSLENMLYYL